MTSVASNAFGSTHAEAQPRRWIGWMGQRHRVEVHVFTGVCHLFALQQGLYRVGDFA
jgi:hypothetical protein